MKLTKDERKAKKIFEREIKHWLKVLMIDPIWTIRVNVAEDEDMCHGDASVDIGASEYFVANLNITRCLLSLKKTELMMTAASVACHEMLHIATADYQRAAIVAAGGNAKIQEELRYRYEQMISRFSMILIKLNSQYEEECEDEPIHEKDLESTKETSQMSEVPVVMSLLEKETMA
jgi:hypothetical protein